MGWKQAIAALALCAAAGVAGAAGRLADVSIHDQATGRPLPLYLHEGRWYVAGQPGREYQVRIRNRSGRNLLAVVSVDGVNAISGETADWSQSGYLLGPHQSYGVQGWRKSLDRVAAFYFTSHRNAYATRTGRPDNVGVIGVALFREKPRPAARIGRVWPGSELPYPSEYDEAAEAAPVREAPAPGMDSRRSAEDAPLASGRSWGDEGAREAQSLPRKSASIGTGHGRRLISEVTYADFERATDSPAEIISIHYDSYANLLSMGVIRSPRASLPTPFPGSFVPDPH